MRVVVAAARTGGHINPGIAIANKIKQEEPDSKILFIGTIDKSIVHPREIIKEACLSSTSYIVVMHNHPSLDVNPSKEDIAFTMKLKTLMNDVGIPLVDHIITNGVNYYSFYENYVDFK